MSRIGKLPISIPAGVTVTLKDDVVTVKGPKGEMSQYVKKSISMHSIDYTVDWCTIWLLVYQKDIRKNWNLSV